MLANLDKLERLSLFDNGKIKKLDVFEHLPNIKFLDASFINSKLDFSKIGYLRELEYVELFGNKKIKDFSEIEHVKEVKHS
ncbi:MAG: hypothetical protein SOV90_10495 [Lachnospiraceae bacterium]|nr:hypothetical protein [Clostridiales bacterium]MDY2608327.1 hypothetical protein [Lachnospiraceae bacterium]